MRFNLQAQEEIAPGLRFWGMELSAIPVMIHLLLMMTDTHDALFESWTVMCVLVLLRAVCGLTQCSSSGTSTPTTSICKDYV